MAELVSLVMPARNPRADWLREAVLGALAQEGCAVEVVVVDDGSDLLVSELLTDVEDERLRILRIEHGGTSRARNAGISVSTGSWLRFVDCDDVAPPASTAHLLSVANGDAVLAYGATELCDEHLRLRATMVSRLQGDVMVDCLLNRFEVYLQALLFPRAIVELVGEWDPAIAVCQDWDFVLRALEHAPVRGDDRPVYRYRQHLGSASAGLAGSERSQRLSEEGMRLVVQRYFERHPEQRGTDLERRANAQVELIIARGHREEYLAHLGRARDGDTRAVIGELAAFARLVIVRAVMGQLRRRRSPAA